MTDQYLSVEEARKMLNVSKMKMSAWISSGTIKTIEDMFDRRRKLIKRSDVEVLMAMPGFRQMANDESTETHIWAGSF